MAICGKIVYSISRQLREHEASASVRRSIYGIASGEGAVYFCRLSHLG